MYTFELPVIFVWVYIDFSISWPIPQFPLLSLLGRESNRLLFLGMGHHQPGHVLKVSAKGDVIDEGKIYANLAIPCYVRVARS